MRTIMFRGKTLRDNGMLPAGSWITGGYYMDDCYGGCPQGKHYILTWNSGGPGGFMDLVEVELESVGQFTGLKDKNGKWIYEGDIVEYEGTTLHGSPHKIKNRVSFHFGRYMVGILQDLVDVYTTCEIIGNIFQHPELINS